MEPEMRRALVPCAAMVSAASVASDGLHAADLRIQPHADVGVMYYEYSQEASVEVQSDQEGADISDFLPYVGGGLTVSYEKFFADIYGQITAEGTDRYAFINNFGDSTIRNRATSDFSRKEANVTFGYRITDTFSILSGYKYAEATFKDNFGTTDTIVEGDTLAGVDFDLAGAEFDLDFTYHGPFAGISYTVPIERLRGSLHFTTAFAYLFGDIEQDAELPPEFLEGAGDLSSNGESVGYNFGISWTGRFTDRVSYSFLADASRYDFDSGGEIDFKETAYRLRGVLGYSFDVSSIF